MEGFVHHDDVFLIPPSALKFARKHSFLAVSRPDRGVLEALVLPGGVGRRNASEVRSSSVSF